MKKGSSSNPRLEDYLACYGEFSIQDPVCRTLCALRIKCAIERDHNDQIDIFEELLISEGISPRMQ